MARLLGIDPGAVRCGLAISDSAGTLAFPRPALRNDGALMSSLRVLVDEEHIGAIVVGRPVALAGHETASTEVADEFYRALVAIFSDLPVSQWDERLTTREAQRSLSAAGLKAKDHRARVDSAAAVIMLQNYLDGHRAL